MTKTTRAPTAAPGKRDVAKGERRRQIIHAARELIRETGNAGLSMRALAARAGVSLATPYNLFGSKRAIVLAVLDDVREYQSRFSTLKFVDPLEQLFSAVDIAIEFYVADAAFYRTLWGAVFDVSDDVRTEILNPVRNAFWRNLIQRTAEAGVIAPEISTEQLFRVLDRSFESAMFEWVMGEVSSEDLAASVRYSYALILNGAASQEWRGPLQARLLESQACLADTGTGQG